MKAETTPMAIESYPTLRFCKLCDRDCPCEVGPGKPNCHMCKYCKYCYMCKVCDTVCQPGGVIDRISSKIFSDNTFFFTTCDSDEHCSMDATVTLLYVDAIPRYNKDEIDKDIDGVKTWIDKAKEEL